MTVAITILVRLRRFENVIDEMFFSEGLLLYVLFIHLHFQITPGLLAAICYVDSEYAGRAFLLVAYLRL